MKQPKTACLRSKFSIIVLMSFEFSLSSTVLGAPPANDDFANATLLSGVFDTASGSTKEATREIGEPSGSGVAATVWFKWVAPDNGRLSIPVLPDGDLYDIVMTVWSGTGLVNLRAIASIAEYDEDIDLYNLPVAAGHTYWISVGMNRESTHARGNFDLGLVLHTDTDVNSLDVLGASSENDVFDRAFEVDSTGGTVISYGFDTVVTEVGEPSRNLNRSTWFVFEAPADGRLTVSAAGSDVHNHEGAFISSHNKHFISSSDKSSIAYRVDTFAEMTTAAPVSSRTVTSGLPGTLNFVVEEGEKYFISTGVEDTLREHRAYAWRVMTFGFTEAVDPPIDPPVTPPTTVVPPDNSVLVAVLANEIKRLKKKIKKAKGKSGKQKKLKKKLKAAKKRLIVL